MIDERIGIRMCKHKRIRKEYGTITYQETKIVLPDPKAHYDEIHALIKKEKKKEKKHKVESKKIDIKKMTKEEQIENLVDLPTEKEEIKEEIIDFSFTDEPIERLSGEGKNKKDNEDKDKKEEEKQEKQENTENKEDPPGEKQDKGEEDNNQKGGLMKKIYVTDLSVDKDKEMFQM